MLSTLKSQWVAALRSGEYKQGVGELAGRDQHATTYCCLGVLCRVTGMSNRELFQKDTLDSVGREELLGPWNATNGDKHYNTDDEDTHTTTQRKLAAMNDNELSFSEIADWIEKNVPVDQ